METVFAFLVSILVRKPTQIKWFPHFLRFGEESADILQQNDKKNPGVP